MKYVALAALAILAASPAMAAYVLETPPDTFGHSPQQFQRDMATWNLQREHNRAEERYERDKRESESQQYGPRW